MAMNGPVESVFKGAPIQNPNLFFLRRAPSNVRCRRYAHFSFSLLKLLFFPSLRSEFTDYHFITTNNQRERMRNGVVLSLGFWAAFNSWTRYFRTSGGYFSFTPCFCTPAFTKIYVLYFCVVFSKPHSKIQRGDNVNIVWYFNLNANNTFS